RLDLALRRCLVQTPLAARRPLEVLDGVGDVNLAAVDACGFEGAVEQSSSGADEGQAFPVFLVARLLAYQHHPRVRIAFAEHGLRRVFPERAIATCTRALLEIVDRVGHPG